MPSRYALALASLGGYQGVGRFLYKNRYYLKQGYRYYKRYYGKKKMYMSMRRKKRGSRYSNKRRRVTGSGKALVRRSASPWASLNSGFPALAVNQHELATAGLLKPQTLYTSQFDWPQAATTTADINSRNGVAIYCKGLKICRHFKCLPDDNPGTRDAQYVDSGGPYVLHWALLQLNTSIDELKGELDPGNPDIPITDDNLWVRLSNEFFRDNAGGVNRWTPFQNMQLATDPWEKIQACGQINPHHIFKVITHKKRVLAPKVNRQKINQADEWEINQYFKIGKKFQFHSAASGTTNEFPDKPVFEVMWYTGTSPSSIPANTGSAGQFGMNSTCIGTTSQSTVYYSNVNRGT